jgi:hypothetical protein
MLDEYNPLVKIFRQAHDFLEEHKGIDISIRIVGAVALTKLIEFNMRCHIRKN